MPFRPQSLYEMYVVCTRPADANGFGMTAQQAGAEIAAAKALFEILSEAPQPPPLAIHICSLLRLEAEIPMPQESANRDSPAHLFQIHLLRGDSRRRQLPEHSFFL
ncbi:MAG: hypothetical protein ACYDBH_18190 [Acidobacteriaceae bacterium]